jgi:hypothetical protein
MKTETQPSQGDDQRAFRICCASKRGQYVAPDDLSWVYQMYDKFPEWAKALQGRVFDATKPFGSK